MPSTTVPSILPDESLLRLKSLEDRIAYKYSQDRIDQGLDQDGNEIEDAMSEHFRAGENEQDYNANMQWLLKLLIKLEEVAPAEGEEEDEEDQTQETESRDKASNDTKITTKATGTETSLEMEYRQQHELLTERVSSCLAHFCGRAASGAMTRTWTYKTDPPQSLQIHDPSFTGGDVGFKTFGSAYLLSKHIAHGDIPQLEPWNRSASASSTTSLPLPKILELGSGTGLVGFSAALFSNPNGPKVILSDYHPNVISTLHHNSALNHLENRCDIQLLDWRDVLERRKRRWNDGQFCKNATGDSNGIQRSTEYDTVAPTPLTTVGSSSAIDGESDQEMPEENRMDLVIGAEVVYDHGHAELVAHVVDEYLKRDLISDDKTIPLARRRPAFHIMFPIRKTHSDVIADFDFWMDKMGLVDCREAKEWGREDGETTFLYHWREYVRRDHLNG
ncbi:hypothetical protein BGZ80_000659 [Entomortierella chlamydospora]|uniref:Uncharacterized protein n=1 Tax=Entomortierella chlamydospora TaxID=101097 RepID=A0A9P6T3N3_9FUNG|nr:hypothetical protein BGZ80_000659 [Entomortierella chlamydospora]